MMKIFEEIENEMARAFQQEAQASLDKTNTDQDFIRYSIAYIGRAMDNVIRNEREGVEKREMLIKATGLLIRAIQALD